MILEYLFCCEYTTNDKIIDLLEDLATYKQTCPLTNKITSYHNNYYKLYKDILKHFKIKDDDDFCTRETVEYWSSIKKKVTKDLFLKNFIIDVKNTYSFDEDTINNLKRDLKIGLAYKNINNKNIIIENNKICKIEGLILTTNSYKWSIDISNFKK
jgi:hypothetical protein